MSATSQRQLFLNHIAQTTDAPLMLEMVSAEGIYIYGADGTKYLDLISGISVSNLGHSNPKVVEAVQKQAASFMYLMVNGEYIHSPQVQFATRLTEILPDSLDSVYFVNSGSEGTEGALKLAKRYTGRREVLYFANSYHGSTHGALSILGDEYFKNAYRPLLPGTRALRYNNLDDLDAITEKTACIVVEAVQAEAGIYPATQAFMQKLRDKCTETGCLMVLDEAQTGLGRTGKLFAFQHYGVVPDILLLAKGLGGGMPMGAFISSKEIMSVLQHNPILGHITTFGGHPVCCAAGLAALNVLLDSDLVERIAPKAELFAELLQHPAINAYRGMGFMMALEFDSFEQNKRIIDRCIANGVLTDWFLFGSNCLRIAPPLIIEESEIRHACKIILEAIQAEYD